MLLSGNPLGAATTAILGHGVGGTIGAKIGGAVDRTLGRNYSPLELDAANANRFTACNGLQAPATSLQDDLEGAQGYLNGVGQQQADEAQAAAQRAPTIKPQLGIIRSMQTNSAARRLAMAKAATQPGSYDTASGLLPDAVPVNSAGHHARFNGGPRECSNGSGR